MQDVSRGTSSCRGMAKFDPTVPRGTADRTDLRPNPIFISRLQQMSNFLHFESPDFESLGLASPNEQEPTQ
jgi:hypothetical protein